MTLIVNAKMIIQARAGHGSEMGPSAPISVVKYTQRLQMTTGVRIGASRKALQRMDSTGCSFASDQDDCEAMGWSVVKMFVRAMPPKSVATTKSFRRDWIVCA